MNRYHSDSNFKILHIIRGRIYKTMNGLIKSKPTLKLLGCSIEHFKEHLQNTAIQNGYHDFDINNYSGKDYHIDHIIPCASFDLSKPEEQQKCFHWSNMQILSSQENLEKSDKLI